MMKSYGTPASEGDVQRAQFLNYLKAPKPLQLAMQKFSPDSDAYRGIQNSMASAEEDLGTRLGMPAPARQWTMATAGTDRAGYGDGFDGTPGQTPPGARSLVERTVSGLPAGHPLTQMLNPQAEADRKARAAERQAAQPAINARGVAGATFGEVNGQQMLVPQAGRYGEFQAATAALGLNGQMGVDRGTFEQKRSDLVRGQEASRRQVKKEAAAAGELGHSRALEIAGIKAYKPGGAGKYGDTVSEAEQKAGIATYNKAVTDWRKNLTAGNNLAAMVAKAREKGETIIKFGNAEMDIDVADAKADEWITASRPTPDEYYTKVAPKPTSPTGTAPAKSPGMLERAGKWLGMGGGQAPAPNAPAAPAAPANRQQARNAYISSLDPALWNSLDHNEREQFLASQGL